MDEEQGKTGLTNANMFIELCQLTEGVPRNRRSLPESTDESDRYWHERYRWVEMEEAYDAAVGEFAPPEVPNFTYEEINNFRNRFKSGQEPSAGPLVQSTKIFLEVGVIGSILDGFPDFISSSNMALSQSKPSTQSLMSKKKKAFRQACEQATSSSQLYAACKEQLNHWVFQSEKVVRGRRSSASEESDPFEEMEPEEESPVPSIIFESVSSREKLRSCTSRCFHRLCPPFRDLVHGLVEVVKKYASDFKDAFVNGNASVAFGSILFIYFVIFSPAITFGTLMQTQVDPAYSVSNSILTSGITTILYSLFAGQPIAIIGPSGPGFIMEKLIATEAKEMNMNYFNFRAWCLIYAILMGFILLSLNLSGVAKLAKKSMEELFSAFISGFLIIKALFSLLRFIPQSLPPLNASLATEAEAAWRKAAQSGVDAFIALLMVCFSMTIAKFKASHLVRRRVRFWVGAMNVPLGMIAMSAVNRIFFWAYDIKRLLIPSVTNLNYSTWFNIPDFPQMTNYGSSTPSYVHGRAIILGFIMGFLVFVEIGLNR
ncbi:Anion exchange protein 3 [Sparganum proliferum]